MCSIWALMAGWLTSPWFVFLFVNLTILTIFSTRHFGSQIGSQRNPPQQHKLAQAPSLLYRVGSFNLSLYNFHQPNAAPLTEFLQPDHANPHPNSDHPPTQLTRSPSLLDRLNCFNLSSLYRSDSTVPEMGSATSVISSLATSSMAFQGASSSFSSSFPSSPNLWTYDVFLSYRGEDTGNNFSAHLYDALDRNRINTYIDNNLRRGKSISPALVKAIGESRISIIVFSQNYASSSSCLDELTAILECRETKGQIVLPVFYKVHRKRVGEALAQHTQKLKDDKMKVKRWKTALTQLANLSRWHLKNGNESKFIRKIVGDISRLVSHSPYLAVPHCPIGIESRVRDVKLLLNLEMNATLMVGIFGMGGIGKSTVTKVIYNSIASQFQGSCFLAIIRETSRQPGGLVRLQEMLLSNILGDSSLKVDNVDQGIKLIRQRLSSKRVLLILDDVDQLFQLKALAGQCGWFGLGSRVIITTRDRGLLIKHEVDTTSKVKELNHNEGLQLFSWHAFKRNKPDDDYVELTEHVIRYAGGLPLALEVLGMSLYGRSVIEWRSALDRCKRIPDETIQKNLRISYDELNDTEKDIFLDIACFFKGERVDYVIKILDGFDFFPNIGIKVLIDKSLITIDQRNTFMMHDLLQEMGREIVRQESPREPGRRSRLWFHEDVRYVLEENTGGKKVEGILVDLPEEDLQRCLNSKAFKKMKRLRLFINRNAHFFEGFDSPNELRLIDWPEYPSQSLPSNICGKKVVIFEMRNILFKQIDELKNFNNMTILVFSNCKFLTKIPDLSNSPNLHKLILDNCTNLVEIHHYVGFRDKFVYVSIFGCSKLRLFAKDFSS